MKQLIDLVPLVLFFLFFKMYDIYEGVKVLMLTSTVVLLINRFYFNKVKRMELITWGMIIAFGVMTLYFRDPAFIKWKFTLVYLLFAATLFISRFILGKDLIKSLFEQQTEVQQENAPPSEAEELVTHESNNIETESSQEAKDETEALLLTLPSTSWRLLNIGWILFFTLCALINIYVTYTQSDEFWRTFKFIITPLMMLGMFILSVLYLYYMSSRTDRTS